LSFTPGEIAWAAFALLAGGFVKGIVGIGLPLVATPILTLGFPLKTAVGLMVLPMTVTNLFQAFQGGMFLSSLQRFWPLLVSLLVAVSFSTKLLVVLPQELLCLVVGLAIIIVPTIAHFSPSLRIPPRREKLTGFVAGLAAGFIGGISGFYGPLIIVYLVWLWLQKDFFVAAVSLMFFVGAVGLGAGLIGFGVSTTEEVVASGFVCLPCFLGLWLGQKLRFGLNERTFSRFLLVVYIVTGGSFLLKAF
jgi:uncharacterized membrane protein YfcA